MLLLLLLIQTWMFFVVMQFNAMFNTVALRCDDTTAPWLSFFSSFNQAPGQEHPHKNHFPSFTSKSIQGTFYKFQLMELYMTLGWKPALNVSLMLPYRQISMIGACMGVGRICVDRILCSCKLINCYRSINVAHFTPKHMLSCLLWGEEPKQSTNCKWTPTKAWVFKNHQFYISRRLEHDHITIRPCQPRLFTNRRIKNK